MALPHGVYRADHVGSLLRPTLLKNARLQLEKGKISASELRKQEDYSIRDVVARQLANGLRSITDGEFRRRSFHIDFLTQLGGVEYREDLATVKPTRDSPPRLFVTERLHHPRAIQVDDFKFLQESLQELSDVATAKVCIPAPTALHFRGGRENVSREAYPDMELFFQDLAKMWQQEIADLYAAGCRFVQLDETNMVYLCDPFFRKAAAERDEDPDQLPVQYAELINAAVSQRPTDMIIGMHLCRGNYRSQWFASGGYEPIAQVLFEKVNVDVFFLEFDDERSGDFSPLRYLPENKIAVLGLMTSKRPDLEDKETVIRRLHEASKYCPKGLEQLCLSHQCGFSSSMEGNELTEEDEWKKITLMAEISDSVWRDL
jgi:5-methyltetrahydropteroyltriglutamate--homocysteine methyltransferase